LFKKANQFFGLLSLFTQSNLLYFMKFTLLITFLICIGSFSTNAIAQDISADSLLADLNAEVKPEELLPKRMMLTQRMFWGEKGLLRLTHIAPELSIENRQKELKIRRNMFKIHQAVGIATAVGMLAQGFLGAKVYRYDFTEGSFEKYDKLRNFHSGLATGINIAYGTTALMAFTSPPKQINRKGISNMKVHKALSYIHLTGMITTNVLSGRIKENVKLKPLHRAAAYTTFGSFAAAIAIIKFEF
jgi:hypothetical protein